MKRYVLDENFQPKECNNLLEYSKWFGNTKNRRVKLDKIKNIEISTVFLGMDHAFGEGPPVLWETMVFDESKREVECERCPGTYHDALEMHEKMLDKYKS